MTRMGIWPGSVGHGNDYETLLWVESILGRKAVLFRERGSTGPSARGSLDNNLYKTNNNMVTFCARGPAYRASVEINSRVGGSQADKYIPYTQAMASWETEVRAQLASVTALGPGPHLLEIQSEANLSTHDSGTAAQYRTFVQWVHDLAVDEGVRQYFLFCTSLSGAIFSRVQEADQWCGSGVIDIVGNDRYTITSIHERSFAENFDACRAYAKSRGLRWAVPETGVQEKPGDASFKERWYRDIGVYLDGLPAGERPWCIVFNWSNDGNGGWPPDTSSRALAAFKLLITKPVMMEGLPGGTAEPPPPPPEDPGPDEPEPDEPDPPDPPPPDPPPPPAPNPELDESVTFPDLPAGTSQLDYYLETLTRSHWIKSVISVYDASEQYLTTIDSEIVEGQVDLDITRAVERSLSLTLADTESLALFSPDGEANLYADKFIGVDYCVWVDKLRQWVFVPVFYGPITRFESNAGEVHLECQDKSSLLQTPVVWGRYIKNASLQNIDTDVRFASELLRTLLKATGEVEANFEFTGFERARLPKGFKLPKEPETLWQVCRKIVRAANQRSDQDRFTDHRLFYDGRGKLRVENMANSGFAFTDDPDTGSVLNEPAVSYNLENFRNTVVVRANRGQGERQMRPVIRTLPDDHPLSPVSLARNDVPRYIVEIIDNSNIRTRARAREIARTRLKRLSTETVEVAFDALPIPHLIPGARCELHVEGTVQDFFLTRFSLPLRASDSMSVGYNKKVKTGPTKPTRIGGRRRPKR